MTPTSQKPPLKTRLLEITITLLALSAILLQISSQIFSCRVVLRTTTHIFQLGTNGANVSIVATSYPNPDALNSAYDVWWDHGSRNFVAFNFMAPHLTLQDYALTPDAQSEPSPLPVFSDPEDPNILISEWKACGLHHIAYAIVPGEFPNLKVPQSLTELSTWWLTPFWLLPLVATIRRRQRNRTLRSASVAMCSVVFTTAASASLLLAIVVAVFWYRGLSRDETLQVSNLYTSAPLQTRIFETESYSGLLGCGIYTKGDPPLDFLNYSNSPPFANMKPIIDATFGSTWKTESHPLTLNSPFFKFQRRPNDPIAVFFYFRPWLLQVLTLLLPAAWIVSYRARRKRKQDIDRSPCPNCSYDMRAHSAGARSPNAEHPSLNPSTSSNGAR